MFILLLIKYAHLWQEIICSHVSTGPEEEVRPWRCNYRLWWVIQHGCWELNLDILTTDPPHPDSRLYFWSACTTWPQALTSEANPWLKLIESKTVLGTQNEHQEEAGYSLAWPFGQLETQTTWNIGMAIHLDAREFCVKPFIKAAWKVKEHMKLFIKSMGKAKRQQRWLCNRKNDAHGGQ